MSLIPEADPITIPIPDLSIHGAGDSGALGLAGSKIQSLQSTIASLTIELQQTKLDLVNKSNDYDSIAYNLEIAQYQNAELGNELVQLKDSYNQLQEQLTTAIEERDGVFADMVKMSSSHTAAMDELSKERDKVDKAVEEMAKAIRSGMAVLGVKK